MRLCWGPGAFSRHSGSALVRPARPSDFYQVCHAPARLSLYILSFGYDVGSDMTWARAACVVSTADRAMGFEFQNEGVLKGPEATITQLHITLPDLPLLTTPLDSISVPPTRIEP